MIRKILDNIEDILNDRPSWHSGPKQARPIDVIMPDGTVHNGYERDTEVRRLIEEPDFHAELVARLALRQPSEIKK